MANNKSNKPAKKQIQKAIVKRSENPIYFSEGIMLLVTLQGTLSGATYQTNRIIGKKWFPSFDCPKDDKGEFLRDKQGHYLSAVELDIQEHCPREQFKSYCKHVISKEVLRDWATGPVRGNFSRAEWLGMTPDQRIKVYLDLFDQGMGYTVYIL